MDSEFLSKTEEQEWIGRRVSEVGKVYSAYHALTENGVELIDEATSLQILCPFHGDKNKPSARYYAPTGRNNGHFWCFKCKIRLDGVSLYSRFKKKNFFESLAELERRFGIKVPKRPTDVNINPSDRSHDYKSVAWSDMTRHLGILENKLIRNRHKATLPDYIKVCKLLDVIRYDFTLSGEPNDSMVRALNNASEFIDNWTELEL